MQYRLRRSGGPVRPQPASGVRRSLRDPLIGPILGIDTATDALSVAIGDGSGIAFSAFQRRRRGHAEALAPLIHRALTATGLAAADLSAIGVTVGPGTFTGLRIGLAAARGMRLALKRPLTGVSTLELIAVRATARWPDRPVLAALDARRGQVYAQYFRRADGPWPEAWSAPFAAPAAAAADLLRSGSVIAGNGAALVIAETDGAAIIADNTVAPDAADLVRLISHRPPGSAIAPPPAPLYLRAADAVPARPVLRR
ncbi:MAG: tRNA (adenosine(37)-N6)-threonylcarbamoyltransferase complex dimerization subunit type 1 TsaB [Minwuia sp.]|uniref:tRNA (adenosine(37)-N6)-threonylcarbamoyltransferase complex dimerization subunit type 1 TsaB n=1 Tax=Minwuia sp. TaxID=2493630 RepID=UPI003A843DBA